jgi:hypothetical protein
MKRRPSRPRLILEQLRGMAAPGPRPGPRPAREIALAATARQRLERGRVMR